MKRIMCLLLLILSVTSVFGDTLGSLAFGTVINELYFVDNISMPSVHSNSIVFSTVVYFGSSIGLLLATNMGFILNFENRGVSYNLEQYVFPFSMDLILGPSFAFMVEEHVRVILGGGFYGNQLYLASNGPDVSDILMITAGPGFLIKVFYYFTREYGVSFILSGGYGSFMVMNMSEIDQVFSHSWNITFSAGFAVHRE